VTLLAGVYVKQRVQTTKTRQRGKKHDHSQDICHDRESSRKIKIARRSKNYSKDEPDDPVRVAFILFHMIFVKTVLPVFSIVERMGF
jgi:hypothetical protein